MMGCDSLPISQAPSEYEMDIGEEVMRDLEMQAEQQGPQCTLSSAEKAWAVSVAALTEAFNKQPTAVAANNTLPERSSRRRITGKRPPVPAEGLADVNIGAAVQLRLFCPAVEKLHCYILCHTTVAGQN